MPNKISSLMGKSWQLFPIFFILVVVPCGGFAADWSTSLYSALGFPPTLSPSIRNLMVSQRSNIRFRVGYDDIYRKKTDHTPALTLRDQYYRCQADFPLRLGTLHNLITVAATQEQYLFDNLRDQVTLVSRRRLEHPYNALTWSAKSRDFLVGAGLQTERYKTHDSIQVTAFPRSEDNQANKYFFDLLKPTFGQHLADSLAWHSLRLSFWGAMRLTADYWLGLAVTNGNGVGTGSFKYINTGKKAALRGARRIDIPIETQHRAVRLSMMSERQGSPELALSILKDEGSFYLDNNPPSFIDFDSLGEGKLRRTTVVVNSRFHLKNWQLRLGLTTARYNFKAFLRTPVLGFEWGILPIAHAANLRLAQSSSLGQQIGIGREISWKNLSWDAELLYTHVRYDFYIKGQADLEFGLTTAPLDYPYKYDLHLLEISSTAVWRIGGLSLQYNFNQFLPYGKRLDRSPIHLSVEKEGVKYAYRGGQRHLISLGYHF